MKPVCDHCKKEAQHGELWAGVRVNATRYHQGHYLCVIEMLGSELTLKAIQRGFLANVDPKLLIDGKLPKFTKLSRPAFEETLE